jgi:hypothetical protein
MPGNEQDNIRRISDYQQKSDISGSKPALHSGGGGGTSDGMEARVAKLEAVVEHIQKDIAEIKTDVREFRTGIGSLNVSTGTLSERVTHLPSKGFIVVALLAALTVIAGLVTFQGSIQNLIKLPPTSQHPR